MTKYRKKPKASEGMNWHHRLAKINGGSGQLSSGNMIEVNAVTHASYHRLFGTKSPQQIAAMLNAYHRLFPAANLPHIADTLNQTWLPTDWELVARKKGED